MDAKTIADGVAGMRAKRDELRRRVSPEDYAAAIGPFRRDLQAELGAGAANLTDALRRLGHRTPLRHWCLLSAAYIDEMIAAAVEVN